MAFSFNPHSGLIVVPVTLDGPQREVMVELALDTGATTTVISQTALLFAGIQPEEYGRPAEITTGSGTEPVREVQVASIRALGKVRAYFAVLCHTLPSHVGIDGVLGLDFFRDERLVIDFRAGQLALE